MHFFIILLGIGVAWHLRQRWQPDCAAAWSARWHAALRTFLLPPLLLFTIAIAVVCMKRGGWMVFGSEGWVYVWVALAYVGAIAVVLCHFARQGWQMLRHLEQYPQHSYGQHALYLLDCPHPYSAQIGFWQPYLVVSQGLLTQLTPEQIAAVLCHEQAHVYYRDTFWFFWLGWLRRCASWLPQTENLWQELLLLREIRADRWAATQFDPLILAEALLQVVRAPATASEWGVAFGATQRDRVMERLEAMLTSTHEPMADSAPWWLGWGLLPLLLIPLHC